MYFLNYLYKNFLFFKNGYWVKKRLKCKKKVIYKVIEKIKINEILRSNIKRFKNRYLVNVDI